MLARLLSIESLTFSCTRLDDTNSLVVSRSHFKETLFFFFRRVSTMCDAFV